MGAELYNQKFKLPPVLLAAIANGGGSQFFELPTNALPYTDRIISIRCDVYVSNATGGPPKHLGTAGRYVAQAIVANKNNVCTFPPAIAGSGNPLNSNAAQAGYPVASDAAFNTATVAITITAGTNTVRITVTNNGVGAPTMDAMCIVEIELVGSA